MAIKLYLDEDVDPLLAGLYRIETSTASPPKIPPTGADQIAINWLLQPPKTGPF
jgi:hypothetical protein